jgi:hypothetical protein
MTRRATLSVLEVRYAVGRASVAERGSADLPMALDRCSRHTTRPANWGHCTNYNCYAFYFENERAELRLGYLEWTRGNK